MYNILQKFYMLKEEKSLLTKEAKCFALSSVNRFAPWLAMREIQKKEHPISLATSRILLSRRLNFHEPLHLLDT